jgi:hypothetical protein
MDYINCHLMKNLARWKNKQWYHQRFDGSPYFMHFIAESELYTEKRKKGGFFSVHYCFFEDEKADWYILMDDIIHVSTAILKEGKNNPDIGKEFIKNWENFKG